MLLRLLEDIRKNKGNHEIKVNIVNDKSDKSYASVLEYLRKVTYKYDYAESSEHFGRTNYWQLVDYLFKQLMASEFDYMIQLPDDIRLTGGFFDEAIRLWNYVNDPRKACLNLLNDYGRDGKNIWTGTEIRSLGDVMETGWVDMCYIAEKKFLEALNYDLKEVNRLWTNNENHSSGVGMQISIRIKEAGLRMYQVKKSLVIHGPHESVMHPNHRKTVPLITNHAGDTIIASMATMPERMNSCEQTIKTILPQVSELQIYLNNFDYVPQFFIQTKIRLFKSQDHCGDLGDVGKFFLASDIKGYHFTIDDDILYPLDYCQRMIACIEKYERKCIITLHGRRFKTLPVGSYYHNDAEVFQCLKSQKEDAAIHVPGSGVMAYHTDTIRFSLSAFRTSNMADIWVAIAAQAKGIPVMVKRHEAGWIKLSSITDESRSIYHACNKNDQFQTGIVNGVDWKLFKVSFETVAT